jgi:ATP-binding cassette, subfamily B, bacterial
MAAKTLKISSSAIVRLMRLIRPKTKKYLAGLVLRVALSTTERMFIAYLLKVIVDAITSTNKTVFSNTILLWIASYMAIVLVSVPVITLWRTAVYEATANVREAVFKHINRLPLGYHELHHSGDALSIMTNDVSAAEKAYQDDLLMLVEASVQGLAAAIFMLTINAPLALVVMASGLAPLVINTLFARPLRKIGQELQERLGMLSERMTDLLAGFQVIRTFNLVDWIVGRFEQANGQVLTTSMKRVRTEAALSAANDFGGLFNFLSMIFGLYLVMNGRTTIGAMIALVQLSNQISYFVYSIGGTVSRVQAALAAADRILALLDESAEPDQYPVLPAQEMRATLDTVAAPGQAAAPAVEFHQVAFGYSNGENVLNGLNFSVNTGEMAAFAGPSGGGKSTIFKLLLGCYPAGQGQIVVQGSPVTGYHLAQLRDLFAYVPQDAYLFAGTIEDNIRIGKVGATQAEVTAAAKMAFADDFIRELPDGYGTVVGERGARLSGGQRQRIAIARALLKDAPILLLDEATSALDSESEQEVQQALTVLMRGRTTLVIAHRFSTILNADRIFVLEKGCVVEQGRHNELLALNGIYRNLYDLQFQQEVLPAA